MRFLGLLHIERWSMLQVGLGVEDFSTFGRRDGRRTFGRERVTRISGRGVRGLLGEGEQGRQWHAYRMPLGED